MKTSAEAYEPIFKFEGECKPFLHQLSCLFIAKKIFLRKEA